MRKATKTTQIIESLGRRLKNGEWAANTVLPSVVALSDEYRVSPGTVALALKSLEREGLLKVIPRHGVVVTVSSQNGWNGNERPPTIGLIGNGKGDLSSGNGYGGQLGQGVLEAAQAKGGAVLVIPATDVNITAHYCRQQGLQGVIFMGGALTPTALRLREEGFPVITANPPLGPTALSFCAFDHGGAICDATRRCIAMGHERIGFIQHETSTKNLFHSLKAPVLEVLLENRLVYNLNDYWFNIEAPFSENYPGQIVQALESLFALPEPPTALFSRHTCLDAVRQWVAKQGLKVPRDVSIILGSFESPVTSVSGYPLDFKGLGKLLVDGLYEIIANPFLSVHRLLPLSFYDGGTLAYPTNQKRVVSL